MPFRRGFKSQCERRSTEYRKKLGLEPDEPLSADQLAEYLGVSVWRTGDVIGLTADDRKTLNSSNDNSWSALTMRILGRDLIIYKPVRSQKRVNSVIMHELSHIILGHELSDPCILDDGSLVPKNYDQEQEDEANWLAGTLLLPRPALLSIIGRGLSYVQACDEYEVSKQMLIWRNRMTGVRVKVPI